MPLTALIATVVMLVAASVIHAVVRENDRGERRAAAIPAGKEQARTAIVDRDDSWHGRQYSVIWLAPLPGRTPALPPGMHTMPAPGEAVLSPRLSELAARDGSLAARYPRRTTLADAGVRSAGELLAYVRPTRGRSIAGDERTLFVRAFGSPRPGEQAWPIGITQSVNTTAAAQAVAALMVIPALLLMLAGVATASTARSHRVAMLRALGAPQATLMTLVVAETVLLAAPAVLAATATWSVISRTLRFIPFTGHRVFAGDLVMDWRMTAAVTLCALIGSAVTAALYAGMWDLRPHARPRPRTEPPDVKPRRLAPLGLAGGLIALSLTSTGELAASLLLAGFVVAIAALPIALPVVLEPVSGLLGRLESVPALLAARRLQWDPLGSTRPFTAYGVLVMLALLVSGYFAVLRPDPAPPSNGEAGIVTIRWLDATAGDVSALQARLPDARVVALDEGEDVLRLGISCDALRRSITTLTCAHGADLTAGDIAALGSATGLGAQRVQLGDRVRRASSAMVLGQGSPSALERQVRTAALALLPAPTVFGTAAFVQRESPLTRWLQAGLILAFALIAIATVVALVDRLLAARSDHVSLTKLGMTPRGLQRLELWQFGGPYAAITTLSFAVGLLMCWAELETGSAPLPLTSVLITLSVALACGAGGAWAVMAFSRGSGERERSRQLGRHE